MVERSVAPERAHAPADCMKRSAACSWLAAIHSSGWCAWAMEPGPHTTVEMPTCWKNPASVPKGSSASGQSALSGFTRREMIAYLLLVQISRMFSTMPGLAGGIARDICDGNL